MKTSVVATAYHRDVREVQPDSALAHQLSDACQHAPFDRLWWHQALAHYCDLPATLHGIETRDGAAMLALTDRGDGHLVSHANWYSFRFRPMLQGKGTALTALARELKGQARRITLDKVPDEDASATALLRAFRRAGWLAFRVPCDTNHVLPVKGRNYTQYLQSRPGRLRTTIKRKSGKVRTEILTRFDPVAWDAYEDIYGQSWKGEEGSPAFLRAFAAAEGEAGRLRLGLAWDALQPYSQPLAAQMWSVEHGTAYIHKLAYRESARALSPGTVLSAALFEHVLDTDRVELVDFGTGDDPYKRDWMDLARPRYRLEFLDPMKTGNAPAIGKHLLRRLAATRKRG